MNVILSPTWELTNEHAASSPGRPVLVKRTTGEAFGAGDVLRVYPEWPIYPVRKAVERMAQNNQRLTDREKQFVRGFIGRGE